MAQVTITIRGRQYQVACEDGQEAHLTRLGRYLDERAADLLAASGSISEPLMLVMVGLVVADELADAAAEIDSLSENKASENTAAMDDAGLAAAIDAVTARVEEIAAKLEAR
jgi:cell division protein ZapA